MYFLRYNTKFLLILILLVLIITLTFTVLKVILLVYFFIQNIFCNSIKLNGDSIEWIKKYRKKIGYTQEQLAMQVNKNTIFISYIERGKKFPSLTTLIEISNALDISLDMLVGNNVNSNLTANLCYINDKLIKLSPNRQQVLFKIMESMLDIELDNQENSNIIES